MTESSYSKLVNGSLKSNYGDLIISTVLTNCIGDEFIWFTNKDSKQLLKYFIDEKRIITSLDELSNIKKDFNFNKIYNIDNYVCNQSLFEKIKGVWKGYIWDGMDLKPENAIINSRTPYVSMTTKKSLQETLVEGMGFKWEKQDYPLPKLKAEEKFDIGLNYGVQKEWTSKQWSMENWENLAKILEKEFTVSWQQGLNNFDEYINWLNSCKLIISCETLGLHLASALRKKVITLSGPIENKEYPYDRLTLIKPFPKGCMPCDSPTCVTNENCLNEITPELVKKKVLEII